MQADSTAKRADPPKRRFVMAQAGQVKNGRPDRKYLLCNPNDEVHGLPIKLDQGWTLVNGGKDGDKERIFGGKVDANGMVTFQGQVLVWMALADFEALQAERLQLVDARTSKSRGKGGIDGLPGLQDWKNAE
ncbi:MAG TPA: hypothetical protein VIU40_07370 [Geobacteraceae bacterium]